LMHIIADGPPDLAPLLTSAFLHIIDSPRTRVHLDPGEEFEVRV
jgi:rapamycin-insensitive companion of mTOR